jgi:hypothetical protein
MIVVIQQIYTVNDYCNTTNFQPMIVVMHKFTQLMIIVIQQISSQ